MGLWDKLGGELVDIIEWIDDTNDTLVWRFERHGNEIKNGAKLTVRESQAAVFISEGRVADVFPPGMYTLETKNMPILSTLMGWAHGFNSPFKAEVYFVTTRKFTDLKWGTKNPFMIRDPEFGPVRLRAFGNYVMKVAEPELFVKEVVGTDGEFTTDEITKQLRKMVVTRFTDSIAESKIPILDMAANYDELGEFVTKKIAPEFAGYGLELTSLLVENISLPPEVEKALDTRTSMGVIGDLGRYSQFQAANAMTDAAKNPGGMAAGGMGMGMGFAMANQMGQAMQGQPAAQAPGAPPPIPQAAAFFVAVNGQQAGPFDVNALSQQAASGTFTADSLVWKQGMAQWSPAGQTPELAGLFAQGPPPIPGSPPAPPSPPPFPPRT
ncbi:MAG: SPFH domain-containing protein [Planctomycetales bacterium]